MSEVIIIDSKAYQEIINKIDAIGQKVSAKEKEPKFQWIENNEFLKLLKILRRTAQSWRDEGIISFTQIRNKIFYSPADIENLMLANYRKAFKK